MPRKATDHVQETRHTLGDLERNQLKKLVTAETFKDYGQFAQGAGLVLIGGGVVVGSLVAALKFAPQVFGWAKGGFKSALDDVAGPGGVLDVTVDKIVKGSPIADRRGAQALAVKRGKVAQNIDVFCTTSSDKYSQRNCSRAQIEKDEYFIELYNFNDTVHATYRDSGISDEAYTQVINFIYRGLGDIDPRHSSRADRHGKNPPYQSRRDSDSDTNRGKESNYNPGTFTPPSGSRKDSPSTRGN